MKDWSLTAYVCVCACVCVCVCVCNQYLTLNYTNFYFPRYFCFDLLRLYTYLQSIVDYDYLKCEVKNNQIFSTRKIRQKHWKKLYKDHYISFINNTRTLEGSPIKYQMIKKKAKYLVYTPIIAYSHKYSAIL